MSKKSKKNKEIDEIFLHIKQLKSELNPIKKRKNKIVEDHQRHNIENTSFEADINLSKQPNNIIKKKEIEQEFDSKKVEINKAFLINDTPPSLELLDEETNDDNDLEEPVTTVIKPIHVRLGYDSTGICDLCKQEIFFEKNLSGLVVGDKFFACEECCKTSSKEDLINWTRSRMIKPYDVRPMGLWITQEKNKVKSIPFRKK